MVGVWSGNIYYDCAWSSIRYYPRTCLPAAAPMATSPHIDDVSCLSTQPQQCFYHQHFNEQSNNINTTYMQPEEVEFIFKNTLCIHSSIAAYTAFTLHIKDAIEGLILLPSLLVQLRLCQVRFLFQLYSYIFDSINKTHIVNQMKLSGKNLLKKNYGKYVCFKMLQPHLENYIMSSTT